MMMVVVFSCCFFQRRFRLADTVSIHLQLHAILSSVTMMAFDRQQVTYVSRTEESSLQVPIVLLGAVGLHRSWPQTHRHTNLEINYVLMTEIDILYSVASIIYSIIFNTFYYF